MTTGQGHTESDCAICGLAGPHEQEMQAIWRTADWSAMNERSQQETHERWIPVCEECASAATTFRVTFPLDMRQHEQRLFRLVVTFGITLTMLVIVLFAGKSLVNSDPEIAKLMYAAGWLLVGFGTIITLFLFSKTVSFELGARRAWSGPWIEKQLVRILGLPKGDNAAFWSQVDLLGSLKLREIPPPAVSPPSPPSPPDPNGSVTISIFPG